MIKIAEINSIFLIFLKNTCLSLSLPKKVATIQNHTSVVRAIAIQIATLPKLFSSSTRLSIELKKTNTLALARLVKAPFRKIWYLKVCQNYLDFFIC